MDNKKYIEDLREIKDITNRTTQFISLSGLSGISTGISALAGAFIALFNWAIGFSKNAFKKHINAIYKLLK